MQQVWLLLLFRFAAFDFSFASPIRDYCPSPFAGKWPEPERLKGFWPFDAESKLADIANGQCLVGDKHKLVDELAGPFGESQSSYSVGGEGGFIGYRQNVGAPTQFTISFYFYTQGRPDGGGILTLTSGDLPIVPRFGISYSALWPQLANLDLWGGTSEWAQFGQIPVIETRYWNFLALTFDSTTRKMSIYNGEGALLGEVEGVDIPTDKTSMLKVGQSYVEKGDPTFMAQSDAIACLMVYDTVLSPSQIGELPEVCRTKGGNPPSDWKRTIVFLQFTTKPGEYLFLRGGIDADHRPECATDKTQCQLPIDYSHVKYNLSHYDAYNAWSKGDNYLDWSGAETGQGTWQNKAAQGSPLIWTTNDMTVGEAKGFNDFNTYGSAYHMIDVMMDCSKTEDGWFELRGFKDGNWEPYITQIDCSGDAEVGIPPYISTSHFAKCGYKNVFIWAPTNKCVIDELAPVPPPGDWRRTVVFIQYASKPGDYLFLRGGIDFGRRPECTTDSSKCQLPIYYWHVKYPYSHYDEYNAWSKGDKYLDWGGAEPKQGTWQGKAAQGSPLVWTTSDAKEGEAYGYNSLNSFGYAYHMIDVMMDCSKTEDGWFVVRGFKDERWEPEVAQADCSGDAGVGKPPYISVNHLAKCGYKNAFSWAPSNKCVIDKLPEGPTTPARTTAPKPLSTKPYATTPTPEPEEETTEQPEPEEETTEQPEPEEETTEQPEPEEETTEQPVKSTTTTEAPVTKTPWPRPDSLLGFWPLNSQYKWNDISGNHFHGSTSAISLTHGPFGDENAAAKAQKADKELLQVKDAKLTVDDGSFTVALFLRRMGETSGGIFEFLDKGDSASKVFQFRYENATTIEVSANGVTVGHYTMIQQKGAWTFVAFVFDDAEEMFTVYGRHGVISPPSQQKYIWKSNVLNNNGIRLGYASRWQQGLQTGDAISCLAIYSAALIASEIRQLFDACRIMHDSPPCGSPKLPLSAIPNYNPPVTTIPKAGQFPYVASVRFGILHCSASILDEYWLVTSSRCFIESKNPANYKVYVGEHDIAVSESHTRVHVCSKIILSGNSTRDIALLQVTEPIDFTNQYVNDACLIRDENLADFDPVEFVFGWGENGRRPFVSETLPRYVPGEMLANKKCVQYWGDGSYTAGKDFCFMSSSVDKDVPCSDDEGSPLLVQVEADPTTGKSERLMQIAVYYKRDSTCSESKPGLFTNLAQYSTWISEKIACAVPGVTYPDTCPQ